MIATGETITIPAGRVAVLPNTTVNGTLVIDGEVFVPSGSSVSTTEVDATVVKQNGNVVANDSTVIHKTGDETIAGVKTFSNNAVFNGNVGIGVTPSAWYGDYTRAIEVGTAPDNGTIWSSLNLQHSHIGIGANFYMDSSFIPRYKDSYPASQYQQEFGRHLWFIAPSGTTGNTITWNTAMTLDNNQLGLYGAQFNVYGYGVNNNFEFVQRTANKGFEWYVNAGSIRAMNLNSSGSLNVSGNVLAGYDGSTYAGPGSVTNGIVATDSNSYTLLLARTVADNSTIFHGTVSGSTKAAILANGNFQSATNSYGSTSDAKLKENVVDTSPKLDKLMQVQVRNFNYIGDEHKQIGVVAQEIEQIFPSIVYETKDTKQVEVKKIRQVVDKEAVLNEDGVVLEEATYKDEEYIDIETVETGETTKNVKYSVIYMMMLKAIQEQQEIINDLKERVEVLEAR